MTIAATIAIDISGSEAAEFAGAAAVNAGAGAAIIWVGRMPAFGFEPTTMPQALPTGWKVTVDNVRCRADAGR